MAEIAELPFIESRPAPLVPSECTTSGNDWFPLHFQRLRKSKWWRRASDLARARNVMLWGEAYQTTPAGSLPDDDDELAEAAGFGMDVEAFLAVKAEIMSPWTLCSDGRWYHPTVCEVVLEAWERAGERRRKAAEKKAQQRAKVRGVPAKSPPVPAATKDVPGDTSEKPGDIDTHNRQDSTDTTGQTKRTAPLGASPRGTRLPSDWSPDPDDRAYGRKQSFPDEAIDRIAESFRDWWVAQPGQKGVKLDWPATWRTWIRKEAERKPRGSPNGPQVDWC